MFKILRLRFFLVYSLLVLALTGYASAQNVAPMPFIKSQWFNNSGQPCSGCLLHTYQAGTTTPEVTYSDALGVSPNTNPVVLDATGRGSVFLNSTAYKFVLESGGGVTYWTIDNITASNISLLNSNNTWTGTQDFQGAVTFDNTAQFNVGLTSLGPNVLGGGGSMSGTWSGSPIFSGTPNFSNGFTATTGTFSGQIISTLITGTPPFVIASLTEVPNLNANFLEGCTWEVPCPIGTTTPSTAVFTDLASTTFSLHGVDCTVPAPPTAGQVLTALSPTTCEFQNSQGPAVQAVHTNNVSNTTILGTNTTIKTQAITFPSAGCPCRAFISYSLFLDFTGVTNQPNINFWVSDGANVMGGVQTGQSNASGGADTFAGYGGFSTVAYANSASVTFTLFGIQAGAAGATIKASADSGSGSSTFQVTVLTSVN